MANTQGYWDGQKWTQHMAPLAAPHAARAADSDHGGLIASGYITAVLFPLVGFIIGIVLCAKGKGGHGVACMVLAVVAFFFWLGAFYPDTEPTYYGGGY